MNAVILLLLQESAIEIRILKVDVKAKKGFCMDLGQIYSTNVPLLSFFRNSSMEYGCM